MGDHGVPPLQIISGLTQGFGLHFVFNRSSETVSGDIPIDIKNSRFILNFFRYSPGVPPGFSVVAHYIALMRIAGRPTFYLTKVLL